MLEPIRPTRLADVIAERIQTMILEGALKPGEKLIAERDLAEALGVSRPSLREGLAILEEKGLLTTSKSGTTVARFLNRLSDPLASLLADDERVSADYFEYRLAMETEATALAARRANDVDRAAIRDCLDRMRVAHASEDPSDEADSDVALHSLVYGASHNVLMLHIMTVLADLMHNNIFYNRKQLYRRAGCATPCCPSTWRLGRRSCAATQSRPSGRPPSISASPRRRFQRSAWTRCGWQHRCAGSTAPTSFIPAADERRLSNLLTVRLSWSR